MMKERILITALCLALLPVGLAEAQGPSKIRRNGPHLRIDKGSTPVMRSSRNIVTAPQRSSLRAPRSGARPGNRSALRGGNVPSLGGNGLRGGSLPGPSRNGLSGLNRARGGGAPGLGNGNLLGGLLQEYLYDEYGRGRGYDPHAGEKAHAKAYRDAAIANAVVNVVGILANAQQNRQYEACPPASGGPQGHIERKRVLVQPGRTEEYQVWVPEHRIPETGEIVAGHHETRRREIPPVYEIREVWVPNR